MKRVNPTAVRNRLRTWWSSPAVRTQRLLPRVSGRLTAWLAALVLINGILPAVAIVATGAMVEAIPGTVLHGFGSPAGHRAIVSLVVLGAAFFCQQSTARLSASVATTLGARLDADLQQRAILAVNGPTGVRHLDDPTTQNLVTRVVGLGMGGYTPGGAIVGLAAKAALWTQSLAAVLLIAYYRWWLALLIFAAQLWWAAVTRKEFDRRTKALVGQAALLRRTDYFRDLALTGGAAKEIRIFGMAPWLVNRFRVEWAAAMEKVWRQRGGTATVTTLALGSLLASNFLAFLLLGLDAEHGVIGLGALVVYVRAVLSVANVSARGRQDLQISYGAAAVPAVLDLEAAAAKAEEAPGRPVPPAAPVTAVAFEGVTFSYPGAKNPVVEDFHLTIPSGTSMALVGVNGAGKTTLVKLLARFYDPDRGRITVDGTDLREFDARQWQQRIAAIFQDFTRYELSARENVAFGAVAHADDEDLLRRVAERAGILDRVEALPGGWDTPLARRRTGGVELSGGEWQRIALARALFAVGAGARVLVLDEPTANLDVPAEAEFYDRFLSLTAGLTTIIISHRFSTVRKADQICVVDGGHVLELGSHEQLMAAGGRYFEMFSLQSGHYLDESSGSRK